MKFERHRVRPGSTRFSFWTTSAFPSNKSAALGWIAALTVVAATVLAIESLVFIGVHIKYREIAPIIMCVVLGLLMAFIAYGRMVLSPIF